MIKIICDKCGREVYMKNPDLTGRAKIGYEEYDLCKYCILDIKRFINQGKADSKTEPQTIRCPKCGRTDYIRDMEKDMGIKGSHYKYKCINCNTYIKTEPTISKMEQVGKE